MISVKGQEQNRLGICVTAARQTLTLFEGVQIPHSQPKTFSDEVREGFIFSFFCVTFFTQHRKIIDFHATNSL